MGQTIKDLINRNKPKYVWVLVASDFDEEEPEFTELFWKLKAAKKRALTDLQEIQNIPTMKMVWEFKGYWYNKRKELDFMSYTITKTKIQ